MVQVPNKLLVLDIETKPALSYHWRMFKENIGIDQVVEPGSILCVGVKWVGRGKPMIFSEWEHGYRRMLIEVRDLVQEADGIITKNGISFDMPWLMAEWAKNDVAPPAPTTHIDLEVTLKRNMKFLSRKLDFVAKELGTGRKVEHEGFKLWRKVMEGDPAARRKMLRYCVGDVLVTERTYLKLRPYMVNHPHMGEVGKRECGTCGSNHVHVSKWRRTKAMRIQQLQCQSCGAYFDGIKQKVT